jgi:hypothetical protein
MKPKKKVAKKIPAWKKKHWNVCSRKKTSREVMNIKESKWLKYKPPSNGTQRLFFSAPARPYETSESEYERVSFPAPPGPYDTSESESEGD